MYLQKDDLGKVVATLEEKVRDKVQGKSLAQVKSYCDSDKGSLDIFKWQVAKLTDEIGDTLDMTDPAYSWILSNREALEMLMTSGPTSGGYKPVLTMLVKLVSQDPKIKKEPLRLRLAVAAALAFERAHHSGAHHTNIDGIARYHTYVKWSKEKVLLAPFYEITAWHLRYVMASSQESEEQVWARKNCVEEYRTPEKIGDVVYKMVKYTKHEKGSAHYLNTLKNMHIHGGVCGTVSHFAAGMCQAFGIPAVTVSQSAAGHSAFFWYKEGQWKMGNDIDGVGGSKVGATHPWKSRVVSYYLLMNDAQHNLAGFRLSEKIRLASQLANGGDRFALLEEASTECPQNFAVWEELGGALAEPTLSKATVQSVLKPAVVALKESAAGITNVGFLKNITATCNAKNSERITTDRDSGEPLLTQDCRQF